MSILDRLDKLSVVSFTLNGSKDSVLVKEGCDCYYDDKLTKAELSQLIDELKEIHNQMTESN